MHGLSQLLLQYLGALTTEKETHISESESAVHDRSIMVEKAVNDLGKDGSEFG